LGGWLVVQGQLNLGQLVAAEIVLLAIVGSLGRFSFYIDSFYEMAVSASKVSDLTNVGREPNSASPFVEVQSFRGLEIASPLLNEPLQLVAGDVVALRGGKRSDCSQLLRELALDRSDLVEVHWDCDPALDRASGAQHTLILVRPAVLRMTLAENLALLSDEATIESARSKVLDLPLLTAGEKATADQPLTDLDISMSDRARYAVARTFLANQNVILLDMFFNLMELSDQMAFVQEFRKRFPDKVLIINSFDKEIDPFVTKIVQLREKSE
jgi:ABC-type transport system involved in cytochrome c biogenesis ATPase subunit